ncbi:unnamed protein product [Chilo suppressalis]|uniref:Centrosomal protein of 131 kDa n=1 Tax=Chilo suppressalis TaxID=168631 RepID=A0ABN8AZ62_CHISP|nr:unnamed protein product [Chilo suppressalis]
MSKENSKLRLLGSPVNLTYRSKKKDDKRNIRNRPRSALQNSCFTPDLPEKYKRPFSADAKERVPSTRIFLKAFSAELLQSYNSSPVNLKVVPPTTDLLGEPKTPKSIRKDKDVCSNASDYGSEDTFISLGTKIKAKAQVTPKQKTTGAKNHLKYRNIVRKNRKPMDNVNEDKIEHDYGLEIKITERTPTSPSLVKKDDVGMFYGRSSSPTFKTNSYESYFLPLEMDRKVDNKPVEKQSFSDPNIQAEVEQAIDTYSRRLTLTKQQLSLVEEESTQDLESVPSQNLSSLSPENSLDNKNSKSNNVENLTRRNSFIEDIKDNVYTKNRNVTGEPRTYNSFYDDFHSSNFDTYKRKMSSTIVHTDSSSKDSGYPDSGANDEKLFRQNYSLPPTTNSVLKKSNSHTSIEDQPKSLDSASTSSNDKYYHKTYPLDKKWSEPLNHSRLLYKDFFIKKEGHIAFPPHNSPNKHDGNNIPGSNGPANIKDNKKFNADLDYPPYLANSTTKAYTSKVIEDYKKELEAINNLHELTLKDLKTDAISPTPMNIDKMFEQNSGYFVESKVDDKKENAVESNNLNESARNINSTKENDKRDISKISTKELIQNYFKVKEGDYGKEYEPKNLRKFDKTPTNNSLTNSTSKLEENSATGKQNWNNKNMKRVTNSKTIPVNIRNQTQRNIYITRIPLSARIESVQNDKDIDSWMSLSAPSPRLLDIEETEAIQDSARTARNAKLEEAAKNETAVLLTPSLSEKKDDAPKVTDLNSKSTVFDIYTMLKEIESYGENPVTAVASIDVANVENVAEPNKEENTPAKDNFLEIFEFLEKVEQSANDALSVVTSTTPQTIPKLESLLKLPQTELAQRLVTASLQLEERSCCIALLQESLTNHKEQMVTKVSNLEKQSIRNIAKVKQECEETIKRHQNFIDQLINDKKTLNHRIEQLVDERRALEERWKRSAQALEERYKLELRNQHDKMAAAQQVARQRWVRQKAEKIKELTVKGLEGELREMAERQQKEISDLKMSHAEQCGRMQAKHSADLEALRRNLEDEKEAALVKERQLASSRLEKQILELEVTYQEQRSRLVAEMRAENERAAATVAAAADNQRRQAEKWKEEQEKLLEEKRLKLEEEIAMEKEKHGEQLKIKEKDLEDRFEQFKKDFEAEQQLILKRKTTEITAQQKLERDREIERAIESMETEAQAARKELQEAMRRNKEQYEAELKELAETEQATLRRYQDVQARVRSTENRCAELEVTISQLETRNKVLVEKNSQLEARIDEIKTNCDESWRKKVEDLHRDVDAMKKTHEEQMHQLYAKVKVAVARKDSAIQALTREAAKYQEKVALLEQKLQQQRKDFLKHK